MFKIKSHRCKECAEPLHGRSDKLFCEDACRVKHHRRNNSLSAVKRGVDQVLQKNRTLLSALRKNPLEKLGPEDRAYWLRRKGFDFNFHTHVQLAQDGRMVIMCYDEGYVLEGDGVIPWVERGDMNRSLAPRLLS